MHAPLHADEAVLQTGGLYQPLLILELQIAAGLALLIFSLTWVIDTDFLAAGWLATVPLVLVIVPATIRLMSGSIRRNHAPIPEETPLEAAIFAAFTGEAIEEYQPWNE